MAHNLIPETEPSPFFRGLVNALAIEAILLALAYLAWRLV